jgi:hypothetical protein
MAAVAPKAALITAYETLGTSSPTFANPLTFGGRIRSIVSVTDVAAADSDADVFHVCPVYSSWRLDSIRVKCDAITSGSDYNLGLYTTAAVDVDENVYADAQTFATAITSLPVDLIEEIRDIALAAQAVWADAGATEDSRRFYYLTYTAITVGSAAGQIATRVHYVDGGS